MANAEEIVARLGEGAMLEGPHWTEPVRALTTKAPGNQIEVQAFGTHSQWICTKLLKPEVDPTIQVMPVGKLGTLGGIPTCVRRARESQ
jgi:predicted LPLAT superfamily acyltransferase